MVFKKENQKESKSTGFDIYISNPVFFINEFQTINQLSFYFGLFKLYHLNRIIYTSL